jgi:hypothetical protein
MNYKTIPAHFDGNTIKLDEKLDLRKDDKLLVIKIPHSDEDTEREDWNHVSSLNLNKAYGNEEPDYSPAMVKEPNCEYKP